MLLVAIVGDRRRRGLERSKPEPQVVKCPSLVSGARAVKAARARMDWGFFVDEMGLGTRSRSLRNGDDGFQCLGTD